MPAVRGDGMRGLAVFISDIRNCKCYLLKIYITYAFECSLLYYRQFFSELDILHIKTKI